MTRQAKTKATPTTAPSNFQNKCCSIRAERQLLNSFLLEELHVIFSTYPVEPHSGVVLARKLEHGAHSSATTNSSTSQQGRFEVLTDSFSALTGASARQSCKVRAQSSQHRWLRWGRLCLPAPAGMECSGSRPSGPRDLPDWPLASVGARTLQPSGSFQVRAAKCWDCLSGPRHYWDGPTATCGQGCELTSSDPHSPREKPRRVRSTAPSP